VERKSTREVTEFVLSSKEVTNLLHLVIGKERLQESQVQEEELEGRKG